MNVTTMMIQRQRSKVTLNDGLADDSVAIIPTDSVVQRPESEVIQTG